MFNLSNKIQLEISEINNELLFSLNKELYIKKINRKNTEVVSLIEKSYRKLPHKIKTSVNQDKSEKIITLGIFDKKSNNLISVLSAKIIEFDEFNKFLINLNLENSEFYENIKEFHLNKNKFVEFTRLASKNSISIKYIQYLISILIYYLNFQILKNNKYILFSNSNKNHAKLYKRLKNTIISPNILKDGVDNNLILYPKILENETIKDIYDLIINKIQKN